MDITKKKKNTCIAVIVVMTLLQIVLVGIAGYFAYQNILLKSRVSEALLSVSTNTAIPTPSIHPITTILPVKEQDSVEKPLPQTPAKQVLTNWQTYEDPEYGFTFDNPGQYVLEIDPEYDRIRLYESSNYKRAGEMESKGIPIISIPFVEIVSYENSKRLSSLDWFNKTVPNNINPIENYEIVQIAGIDAVRYFWTEEGGGYTTILAHENYVIRFVDTRGIPREDFERLISTFSLP